MNNIQHQLAVKEAVKDKFRGSQTLSCRTVPRYPASAEREFRRITNAFMKMVNESLKAHLPEIMEAYKKKLNGDSRFDDTSEIDDGFFQVWRELEQKIASFGIEKFIKRVGELTTDTSIREWKRAVRQTLGVDLLDDYYKGDFYALQLRKWVEENAEKIKSIPSESLRRMKNVVLEGYTRGKSLRTIQKEIQEQYNVSKSKAMSLARDQIGTLNAQITQAQQKDAGCNRYRWSTSGDSKVRDSHRQLNNKILSWDSPPEMWYISKTRGKVYTGRRCHPGEDYGCRCVAIPVFDIDTLDIPIKP